MRNFFEPKFHTKTALRRLAALVLAAVCACTQAQLASAAVRTECGAGSPISGGSCRVYLTGNAGSASSWTVPSDWNNSNNSIQTIGGGASGSATGNGLAD